MQNEGSPVQEDEEEGASFWPFFCYPASFGTPFPALRLWLGGACVCRAASCSLAESFGAVCVDLAQQRQRLLQTVLFQSKRTHEVFANR